MYLLYIQYILIYHHTVLHNHQTINSTLFVYYILLQLSFFPYLSVTFILHSANCLSTAICPTSLFSPFSMLQYNQIAHALSLVSALVQKI